MFPLTSHVSPSSSLDPSRYVALGLTHVQYDAQDPLAKLLALVTLSPIFLLCSYVTIILYRRELTFLNALVGQLGCEGVNWGLKRLIRQPRPHSNLGKGYGMPSSHSQFLGFFCAFFLAHFWLHHPKPANPPTLVNAMRRFEHLCAIVAIVTLTAMTCYSRYHLSYHSPAQILVGITIGLAIGSSYYYLTEYIPRRPLRLPAPLGSPVVEDVDFVNPFKDRRSTDAKASSTSTKASTSPVSSPPRNRRTGNNTTHGHRRRSSLSALIPELHPAPPIRQLILDHPLAVAFRLRDSWTVWLDGGIEGEYEAWRREWEIRRTPPTPTAPQHESNSKPTSAGDLLTRLIIPKKGNAAANATTSTVDEEQHISLMSLALYQASQCEPTSTAFCVGCVITDAQTNAILSTGFSRELPGNTHAEECALSKLIDQSQLQSQTSSPSLPILHLNLYTSMEPCSERLSGSTPCAQRILSFNEAHHTTVNNDTTHRLLISNIYQGTAEPQDFIADNTAPAMFKRAGITVHVVKQDRNNAKHQDQDLDQDGWIKREALRLAKYGHADQPKEVDGESALWRKKKSKKSRRSVLVS